MFFFFSASRGRERVSMDRMAEFYCIYNEDKIAYLNYKTLQYNIAPCILTVLRIRTFYPCSIFLPCVKKQTQMKAFHLSLNVRVAGSKF